MFSGSSTLAATQPSFFYLYLLSNTFFCWFATCEGRGKQRNTKQCWIRLMASLCHFNTFQTQRHTEHSYTRHRADNGKRLSGSTSVCVTDEHLPGENTQPHIENWFMGTNCTVPCRANTGGLCFSPSVQVNSLLSPTLHSCRYS